MDAYSSYNRSRMLAENEEHTTFFSDNEVLYYNGMPFRLENARATYHRLMNLDFKDQLDKSIEAYIEDMIVMSKDTQDHITNLHRALEPSDPFGSTK